MNHPEYLMRDDALHVIDSIPAADVECCGRLRGVTYEDGKVTAVYIRDTDDVVKVFTPVRHGRWEKISIDISEDLFRCSECGHLAIIPPDAEDEFCPTCKAKMDGSED